MSCDKLFETFRIKQEAFHINRTRANQALARAAYETYQSCIDDLEQRMGRPVLRRTIDGDEFNELYVTILGGRKKTMRPKKLMRRRKKTRKSLRRLY